MQGTLAVYDYKKLVRSILGVIFLGHPCFPTELNWDAFKNNLLKQHVRAKTHHRDLEYSQMQIVECNFMLLKEQTPDLPVERISCVGGDDYVSDSPYFSLKI